MFLGKSVKKKFFKLRLLLSWPELFTFTCRLSFIVHTVLGNFSAASLGLFLFLLLHGAGKSSE